MRLTAYLMREHITSGLQAMDPEHQMIRLEKSDAAPAELESAYYRKSGAEPPFRKFIGDALLLNGGPLGSLKTRSHSLLLFVKTSGRVVAFSFGHAHTALSATSIEPKFGIKVTLNRVDTTRLSTIDARSLDLTGRLMRVQIPQGNSFGLFGIADEQDRVRLVAGKAEDQDFAGSLAGADALHITSKTDLVGLPGLTRALLKAFREKKYRDRGYGFIDHVTDVSKNPSLVATLDAELLKRCASRDGTSVAFAFPEVLDPAELDALELSRRRKKATYEELDIDGIFDWIEQVNNDDVLATSHVRLKVGGESRRSWPLKDFLAAAIVLGGGDRSFVLSEGSWFQVQPDYEKKLRKFARGLESAPTLKLPEWKKTWTEPKFNREVSKKRKGKWLTFDQSKKWNFGKHHEAVEPCDFLTPENEFLVVKDLTKSSTLSHAFSQGSVPAILLRDSEQAVDKFNEIVRAAGWKHFDAKAPGFRATFVWVIGTDRPGKLSDILFFLSLVNLQTHASRIKRAGFTPRLHKAAQS
ncbi:MAG: TIGR04141 family sporadically distributed protein [Deltaproteobacteria bacterium]|nr:TIGR04141 family sporadically distributed protein [Deltaproteobacteria bacterium]